MAWPLIATAQQTGADQQTTGSTTQQQTQGTEQQGTQPPGGSQPAQGTQPQSQGTAGAQGQGFGQEHGQAADTRQIALSQLTAARQALADMTKLPAAAHLEGQARNEINELISSFNALITSTGPEWRQAYDRVQSALSALLGTEGAQGAEGQTGQGAVGTTGTMPGPSIDPSIAAKLNEVRQHVDQFGDTVGVKPGQSAVAQGQATGQMSGAQQGTLGTSGVANEQALRDVDQIGAMIARFLSQPSMSPNQDAVSVSRQDLQQIQQYLNELRQSLGRGPGQ